MVEWNVLDSLGTIFGTSLEFPFLLRFFDLSNQ